MFFHGKLINLIFFLFSNNRVMGLVKHSALSNVVISNQKTLWTVPEQWSLEDAATIPLVYCTVLYALIVVS